MSATDDIIGVGVLALTAGVTMGIINAMNKPIKKAKNQISWW